MSLQERTIEVMDKDALKLALLSSKGFEIELNVELELVEFNALNGLNDELELILTLDAKFFNKDYYFQPIKSIDPVDVDCKEDLNIMDLGEEWREEWDDYDFIPVFIKQIADILIKKDN